MRTSKGCRRWTGDCFKWDCSLTTIRSQFGHKSERELSDFWILQVQFFSPAVHTGKKMCVCLFTIMLKYYCMDLTTKGLWLLDRATFLHCWYRPNPSVMKFCQGQKKSKVYFFVLGKVSLSGLTFTLLYLGQALACLLLLYFT